MTNPIDDEIRRKTGRVSPHEPAEPPRGHRNPIRTHERPASGQEAGNGSDRRPAPSPRQRRAANGR